MEEKNVRKFKIDVMERTRKDGSTFPAYKTYSKNGRPIDVKFRSEVTNRPKEKSVVTVPVGGSNLVTSGEYPVLWISEVLAVEPVAGRVDKEAEEKKLAEYFD